MFDFDKKTKILVKYIKKKAKTLHVMNDNLIIYYFVDGGGQKEHFSPKIRSQITGG